MEIRRGRDECDRPGLQRRLHRPERHHAERVRARQHVADELRRIVDERRHRRIASGAHEAAFDRRAGRSELRQHPRIGQQRLQLAVMTAGRRMTGAADHHAHFRIERRLPDHRQAVLRRRARDHERIFAAPHADEQLVGARLDQLDHEVGKFLARAHVGAGDQAQCRIGRGPDAIDAPVAVALGVEPRRQGVEIRHHLHRLRDDDFAEFRRRDAAPAALEDPEAEHALELAQRLRQRRLADAVQRGRAVDAADPSERHEVVQLAELEMPDQPVALHIDNLRLSPEREIPSLPQALKPYCFRRARGEGAHEADTARDRHAGAIDASGRAPAISSRSATR